MPGDFNRIDATNLEAEFYHDIKELLDSLPDTFVVTEGYRSMARSNQLFVDYVLNKGPKAAPGGISAHNYGMAVDVALDGNTINAGLQMDWDTKHPAWQRLVTAIWEHPRLHSGKGFGDWPHIERLHWKDYVAWRKNYEDNYRYLVGLNAELEHHLRAAT